jgi:hypothetical protein
VSDLGKNAPPSARAMPDVLAYLGEVVVQDACELLTSDDTQVRAAAEANPVHAFLLGCPRFRWEVGFDGLRG